MLNKIDKKKMEIIEDMLEDQDFIDMDFDEQDSNELLDFLADDLL